MIEVVIKKKSHIYIQFSIFSLTPEQFKSSLFLIKYNFYLWNNHLHQLKNPVTHPLVGG